MGVALPIADHHDASELRALARRVRIPTKPDGVSDFEFGRRSDLKPDSRGFISSGRLDHLMLTYQKMTMLA